jgi:hypothetical protein
MYSYKLLLGVPALALAGMLALPSLINNAAQATSGSTCAYNNQSGAISAKVDVTNKTATFTNNTTNCTYQVTVAAYKVFTLNGKAYSDSHNGTKEDPAIPVDQNWFYTQELFNYASGTIGPKASTKLNFTLPNCAYQLDVAEGPVVTKFYPGGENYHGGDGSFRLIPSDHNWFNTDMPLCTKTAPTPTPTVTPTVTPTIQPTVVPTVTPTVVPSVSPTVAPTATPTPSPTPTVLGATPTPTPTPPAQLPSTGPGAAITLSLIGMVGALLGKKHLLTR